MMSSWGYLWGACPSGNTARLCDQAYSYLPSDFNDFQDGVTNRGIQSETELRLTRDDMRGRVTGLLPFDKEYDSQVVAKAQNRPGARDK